MMNIGLIAGNGQFPLIFTKAAKAKGLVVYAVAHIGDTDPKLETEVAGIEWLHVGQIGKLIKFFKAQGISEAAFVGGITKTRLFTDIRPDMKALALLARMRSTSDDGILRALADLLESEGIRIRESTFLLPELLASEGCWTKRKPGKDEKADIDFGWKIAREIGRLDIGQCVVVAKGSVLAVEAIDGSDATILRGGKLGKGNAVVVKICKPNQDFRFDIPAIGAKTIHTMREAGAKVLAIEAGKSVVFDREEMIGLANQFGISIVAMSNQ